MKEKLEAIIKRYEEMLTLSERIAQLGEWNDEEIGAFVDERERIIQEMKKQSLVISVKEKTHLQSLTALTPQKEEEKALMALYARAKMLNKAVLKLDQVISLRMKSSSEEASGKLKVMNTSKKISNYGQGFHQGINAGERYNRLR